MTEGSKEYEKYWELELTREKVGRFYTSGRGAVVANLHGRGYVCIKDDFPPVIHDRDASGK